MNLRRYALPVLAAIIGGTIAALAQSSTVFFTDKGNIAFPFIPPGTGSKAGPAVIFNTTVGSSTAGGAGYFSAINGINAGTPSNLIITGGTASTSASPGAAARLHGGLPGATGVGGDATVRGGIGGATSGNGGLASITGGAGTAGNATGGLARAVGGAGQGSAAGGAAQLTGGLGGATGAGGAVAIAGGGGGATSGAGGAVTVAAGATTTSGNGASVTISAAAGAGSTNGGGSVNLVPGVAVSTGAPGTVQVNGDANLMCSSYYFTGTPAATSQVFYIANRAMMVTSISEVHSVAAGGTSTLDITKDTGTGAPASGTALGTAAFDLNGTANTVQNATVSATVATKTLAAGNRLAVKFNHAIQSSAGVVVTTCMAPL